MNICFEFNGTTLNVPITEQQLKEDAAGIDDFWGDFEYKEKKYQIQIYQYSQEVAIYNHGGVDPITTSKFKLIIE